MLIKLYMSDYTNPFEPKPIEKVKNDIHTINTTLNKIKMEVISIKADISIIKGLLKEQKQEEITPISKGWSMW